MWFNSTMNRLKKFSASYNSVLYVVFIVYQNLTVSAIYLFQEEFQHFLSCLFKLKCYIGFFFYLSKKFLLNLSKKFLLNLSKNFLLSDSGRHWHPPSHPFPPAHKNGTFTMFILLKLLILLTISLLTNILLNYAVYFSIFLGGCMAASTLCILCVVSRHISCI